MTSLDLGNLGHYLGHICRCGRSTLDAARMCVWVGRVRLERPRFEGVYCKHSFLDLCLKQLGHGSWIVCPKQQGHGSWRLLERSSFFEGRFSRQNSNRDSSQRLKRPRHPGAKLPWKEGFCCTHHGVGFLLLVSRHTRMRRKPPLSLSLP